jgi:ankyrin repeat protein
MRFFLVVLLISTVHSCSPFNGEKKLPPLVMAARYGKNTDVKNILAHGANINIEGISGITALSAASTFGHIDTVKLLIESGADVHHKEKSGETALIHASVEGHTEILKILVQSGASKVDINNALIAAAGEGQTESVRLLLQNGADPDFANVYGVTPLTLAIHTGNAENVQILQQAIQKK